MGDTRMSGLDGIAWILKKAHETPPSMSSDNETPGRRNDPLTVQLKPYIRKVFFL